MTAHTPGGDGLVRDISPNDTMFEGDADTYLRVGRSAADGVALAVRAAGLDPADVRRILDLPCGHGRVLRHLRRDYPGAAVVACDLDRDGVDYCAATFGAAPVYSEADPFRLPIDRGAFDLVWVGSLLTHFDAAQWGVFLDFFEASLRPGGVLVFSAHGRLVHERLASGRVGYSLPPYGRASVLQAYERHGFGYVDYPNQSGYGFALAHPAWVVTEGARHRGLRLVHFAEAAWYGHHDLVAYVREPAGPPAAPTAAAPTTAATPPPATPAPAGRVDFTGIDLARGYIDALEATGEEVTVRGWMMHPDRPITDLRLYLNAELVGEVPIGQRPDVGAVFPAIPHSAGCGVNIRLPLPRGGGMAAGKVDLVGCAGGRPVCRMSTLYRADLADVPTPPTDLMYRVSGTRDGQFFKVWGLKCYGDFMEFFARHGRPGRGDRLLDWGCGCGRLSVHFLRDPAGPEVYGCDVDAEAVGYCNDHLRAGRFAPIPLYPPTAYPDGHFQSAIGYSVFTHLTRDTQHAWLAELRRVIAPGGLFVATVHGESAAEFQFPGRVATVLGADGFFDGLDDNILAGVIPAGYYRATYQTRAYTEREFGKYFDIVEYTVRGIGNHQDVVVMRRPG